MAIAPSPNASTTALSPIALSVDPYTCGGALAGRATGGGSVLDVEIVFERGDGGARSFVQTVGSNGVFSVSPTLLSVMSAGSWTVTVTASDAAAQRATAQSTIDLRHEGCVVAPSGSVSGAVVAPTPTPTSVPVEDGSGLVPIVLAPTRPAESNGVAGSSLVAAPRGPIVIRLQGQPAALPTIRLGQTTASLATHSAEPVVDRPGLRLAMTGRTTALTAGWGVLLIGLGTMILRSPWRRRGISG